MKDQMQYKEVSVDIGWGKVRGKIWQTGTENSCDLKIVALHGWVDNCNSFQPLIPHITEGATLLAIDLPGHGLSDHLPKGARYDHLVNVFSLKTLLDKLNWKSVVLLAHSYGVLAAVWFSALFPDLVSGLITMDLLFPWDTKSWKKDWASEIYGHLKFDKLKGDKSPKIYSEKEIIEISIASRVTGLAREDASVAEDAARVLLERGTKQHKDGYIWTHDPKASRMTLWTLFGLDNYFHVISNLKCPFLVIMSSHGEMLPLKITEEEVNTRNHLREEFFQHAPNCMYHEVQGSHHVHLTKPHRVAPLICEFIRTIKNTES
ncbi:unnamed protein product, partial [Meganyctiphanes norvegica]